MEKKFMDGVNNGDSGKGVKLCLGLTDGDFWTRINGTQFLYKGEDLDEIDFSSFADIRSIGEKFEIKAGQCNEKWLGLVRRANCCGIEEKTVNAGISIRFDENGNQLNYSCNKIINSFAEQIDREKVLLRWFYLVLNQAKKISRFNIYSDNGTGTINLQNPICSVEYTGRKFYQFTAGNLTAERYLFCIKAVAEDGSMEDGDGVLKVGINKQNPDGGLWLLCQIA